ncbi:MAG: hypothetical protein ACE5LD_02035 [Candidatus Bipolaricaulia bacterium]
MEELFSSRTKVVKRSEIRELLKLAQRPEVISFAGGLPDPATFPHQELAAVSQKVLGEDYQWSLQYGATEGDRLFRDAVCQWLREDGLEPSLEEITVQTRWTRGSGPS